MAAATHRQGLSLTACLLASAAAAQSGDTTFLDGPALAAQLARNLVHLRAEDLGEQGFGWIVGVDARHVYVLTARHVAARLPPAGLAEAEERSAALRLSFCAAPGHGAVEAEWVDGFAPGGEDVALLRARRPVGYTLEPKALALNRDAVAPGRTTWVLGHEGQCLPLPDTGNTAEPPDARGNLSARQPGVRGGSSGGVLLVGEGAAALVTESDSIVVRGLWLPGLRAQVQAAGAPWGLQAAANIAPTDPLAAQIDLAETLNQYLFAARNAHGLLLQPHVARSTFADYVERYNRAIRRFRDARDKYDGALAQRWPAEVLQDWQALRELLWQVHLDFWRVNNDAATIVRDERTPPTVVERLRTLEPALQQLQDDIPRFLRQLSLRRTP